MKGLEMVKCESLRINMFQITHTGKSVNFPVTLLNKSDNQSNKNVNHASLALKLNAQNANGSTIDVLVTTSYLRQEGKASTDTGEANSKHYVYLLIFLIDFEMAIAITLHSELRLSSL